MLQSKAKLKKHEIPDKSSTSSAEDTCIL